MPQTRWTRADDKDLELALVLFPDGCPNRFENIALYLRKPLAEVVYYYEALVHDIELIVSDKVRVRDYPETDGNGSRCSLSHQSEYKEGKPKRGIPWTKKEHRLFELGLKAKGKGNWKSISREFVKTRSATQVASHAQKYFSRLNMGSDEKKRNSIHDSKPFDASNVTDFAEPGQVQPHSFDVVDQPMLQQ